MSDLKCVVCGKEISGRYRYDGWGNCACASHEIQMCYSCHRLIGRYSTYSPVSRQMGFRVDENRLMCGLCYETCVNSKSALLESVDFVVKLLGRVGFNIERKGIKDIKVITKAEMEKKSPNAEGLCVSMIRANNPKLTTSEIFVLNGLPKIRLESVLAHELLHFWVFYNGVDGGECTEGFCNIGSALVLNYYTAQKGSSLAEHLRAEDNENSDYFYGYKFLEQKKKLQNLGWKNYINDILKRKKITP